MLVDRPSISTGPNPGPPTAETCPDISHVLATAHRIVAFPSAWTQGARARDVSGTPVDPLSPTAIRWCPNGAIQLAAYRLFASHPDPNAFRPVAADAVEALNRNRNADRVTMCVHVRDIRKDLRDSMAAPRKHFPIVAIGGGDAGVITIMFPEDD